MNIIKDQGIVDLLAKLCLTERGWEIVDHWEADLITIGVATKREPRRLVYISTLECDPGRYYYECEVPNGPDVCDYMVMARGNGVDYPVLIKVIEFHLSLRL